MEATGTAALTISREKFNSFISTLLDHNPNPEGDPPPPGPWDPVIRLAAEKIFGSRLDLVALNPQPLPPRWTFGVEFVRLAADRLLMIQETAEAINDGSDRGIIIVGGKISELVEFVCGNNFPRPIPPRPGSDGDSRLSGQELVLMGAELLRFSRSTANERLAQEFTAAGDRLIDTGIERL